MDKDIIYYFSNVTYNNEIYVYKNNYRLYFNFNKYKIYVDLYNKYYLYKFLYYILNNKLNLMNYKEILINNTKYYIYICKEEIIVTTCNDYTWNYRGTYLFKLSSYEFINVLRSIRLYLEKLKK